MSHLSKLRPLRARVLVLPLILLACGGLAACGSSSTGTTGTAANANASAPSSTDATAPAASGATTTKATGATTSTSSTGSATSSSVRGAYAGRIAAMRTCLQKSGITLPQPGTGGPGAAFRNPQLPKGMTRAQYAEAVRKCAPTFAGGPAAAAKRRFANPRFRQALVVFASCLRQHGVPVPAPNTNGRGPIFNTRGLDTTSPKFREARQKCRSTLLTTLRAPAHNGTR